MKKTKKKNLRKEADKALQDKIRAENKICFVCEKRPVSCGHHFILASRSLALRYYLPNIIPICKECHYLIHTQPSLAEPVICFKNGAEWYQDLMREKKIPVKFNLAWIQSKLDELNG